MAFIKGIPTNPFCKFTKQLLGYLKDLNIEFSFYDIQTDVNMRHFLRYYDKFPTYPQLFINGQLIGGVDVV